MLLRRGFSTGGFSSRLRSFLGGIFGEKIQKIVLPDELQKKAQAQAVLAQTRKNLAHSAMNVINSPGIENWTEENLTNLTDSQLMELAQFRFKSNEPHSPDTQLAVKAWEEGSRRGNKDASYSYGASLRSGIGVTKNQTEALKVLLSVAETHNSPFAHVHVHSLCLPAD
jgi:TPR repeat protein